MKFSLRNHRIRSHLTVPRVVPTLEESTVDENLGDESNADHVFLSWNIPDPRWQEFMVEVHSQESEMWDMHDPKVGIK